MRSNRGVAGIDGTVSTTIGAALAHPGRTIALLGDLTFVHDSSGLLIGPTEPAGEPDHRGVQRQRRRHLRTARAGRSAVLRRVLADLRHPARRRRGALCRAYHVEARQIEVADLGAALDEPHDRMRVLEVKADRSSLRELHAAIKAAL